MIDAAMELLTSLWEAQSAADILGAGYGAVKSHHWQHLPFEKVREAVETHSKESAELGRVLAPQFTSVDTIEPAKAAEIRHLIGDRIRQNHFLHNVVANKIDSVRKSPLEAGAVNKLRTLNHASAYLQAEVTEAQKHLATLNKAHPPEFAQRWVQRGHNVLQAARGRAYHYPVSSGILMVAGLSILPLILIAAAISNLRTDKTRS